LDIQWLAEQAAEIDLQVKKKAMARQNELTKPPGSLGQLEHIAIRMAAMQANEKPVLDAARIVIFAADHGVAEEGVSAFPQAVTQQMVRNFSSGGAAISVIANTLNAHLEVVDVGVKEHPGELPGVLSHRVASGTANFCKAPAMTEHQLTQALHVGYDAAERAKSAKVDIFIGGEMGIANTTSAAAMVCAVLEAAPMLVAGPGTGLDNEGVLNKAQVIQMALKYHDGQLSEPIDVLRRVGGFEIAALTGAYLRCAQLAIPVLVDGFISSVAALLASCICPAARDWFWFGHLSAEPAHQMVLQALNAQPILQLNMRLGEASGAAMALPVMRLALDLHNKMATFSEASVSTGELT